MNNTLNTIKNKLKELDNNVYYGIVDPKIRETIWDCIVFARVRPSYNTNLTSCSDHYDVCIIRENYIPEGFDLEVIRKMKEIDGVRLAQEDGSFDYLQKPNTNTVVEMLTLHFVRARKNV